MSTAITRAVLLPLCLIGAQGCSTTFTTLNLDRRVLRVRVTSETPGAEVLHDGKIVGQTPADVEIRYQTKAERIHSGKYKAGWAVLGAGLGMLAGGVAMTAGGAAVAKDGGAEDDDGKVAGGYVLGAFGVGIGLTGLASMGIGSVAIGTSDATRERTVVEPATTVLEVRLPGCKRRSRRFSMSPAWPRPRLTEVGRMHVFDRRLAIRDGRIRISPGIGVEISLATPGAESTGGGAEPLSLPCQVRRLTPVVGFYSRKGRPLFQTRFALRLGQKGRWHKGKLRLKVTLKATDRQLSRALVVQAKQAWGGAQISATVGLEAADEPIHYGQGTTTSN